ncbi:uncharacterized protein A1O9_04709 [Exophiala aquamarina CBS 119918]|uniref:Xylanolytic transcriptional activator regulatory domain-containing protein n=1 Tax=Exophiala aquamarina CBS 119918 TaxID=1182545 RepID=A0A072PJ14_9EURO|nr:uncharacterized protein A1O9_04709 [Exophiala aquamarina CBS 119918]KEF59861.1 hypothetical protein A1O9_04709 [Exophiala aquamarina CBS 119918]
MDRSMSIVNPSVMNSTTRSSDHGPQLQSLQFQFPSSSATELFESRSRSLPVGSPNGQFPILEPHLDQPQSYNLPANNAQQLNFLDRTSRTIADSLNTANVAPTSIGSPAHNPMPDSVIEFPDLQFDNESFLEDVLLCQFAYNPSGLTVPSSPAAETRFLINLPDCTDNIVQLDASELPKDAGSLDTGQKFNVNPNCAFQITANELKLFHAKLIIVDADANLDNFKKPSLSRTLRCMIAYFRHFDPHAPFIHYASFNVSTEHPALVLIMLAIGAVHLSENEFARSAYEASCLLLAQYEKQNLGNYNSSFNLWEAQAALLCAQYGVTSGNRDLFYQAQKHLFTTHMMMGRIIEANRALRVQAGDSWDTWVFLESCTRIVCWMFVVSATCFSLDPLTLTVLPPMPEPISCPSDETIWHATSETEWKAAYRIGFNHNSVDLWSLAKALHRGQFPEICGRISAFTLLAFISGQLCTICTRERLRIDIHESSDSSYIFKGEQALSIWEGLWRKHPRAEQSLTRLDDPLLNDCLSMLCSAYYHLYVGDELVVLRRIAENPDCGLEVPHCKDYGRSLKVIKYAANSWLVRAKIGVRYLRKTRGLEFGPQALAAVYESAWWLHLYGDSVLDPSSSTYASKDDRALAVAVAKIFSGIMNELDEQGTFHRPHSSACLDAIEFYTYLCRDWVWECSSVIESRLRTFAVHLQNRRNANP